jgi:hypothetical protein
MRRYIIIILWLVSTILFSQKYYGLYRSNYSGSLGIQDNPAVFTSQKVKWDVNLVGFGIGFYTQTGFIANESGLSLLNGQKEVKNASDSLPANYNPDKQALFYANNPTSNYVGLMFNAVVHGPSLVFRVKDFSFGFFTNARAAFSAIDVPAFFNYYDLKNIVDFSIRQVDPFSAGFMQWSEIGINGAKKIQIGSLGHEISIGANFKYLMGFEAGYIANKSSFNFVKIQDSIITGNSNVEIGFSTGKSTNLDDYKYTQNGKGYALDLGVEYLVPQSDADEEEYPTEYAIKIGASIKDIGAIQFDKNAQVHKYIVSSATSVPTKYLNGSKYIEEIVQKSSSIIYDDPLASQVSQSFSMALPTSLNLTFDYRAIKHVFVNASVQRRIVLGERQVLAMNFMGIVPRYEKRWFEIGMPLSFIEDKIFGLGAYIRLGFLTVGSDQLNALLFKQSKLNSADFFLALKINPFRSVPKEESYESFGSSIGKRKNDYGCFKF